MESIKQHGHDPEEHLMAHPEHNGEHQRETEHGGQLNQHGNWMTAPTKMDSMMNKQKPTKYGHDTLPLIMNHQLNSIPPPLQIPCLSAKDNKGLDSLQKLLKPDNAKHMTESEQKSMTVYNHYHLGDTACNAVPPSTHTFPILKSLSNTQPWKEIPMTEKI